MTSSAAHVTVLLEEAVEALAIKPEGVYIDATFGRGTKGIHDVNAMVKALKARGAA